MSLFFVIIIITIKDQIFTISISLNSCLIRSTPLFSSTLRENHGEKDDGLNGTNEKEPTRTPRDLGKR